MTWHGVFSVCQSIDLRSVGQTSAKPEVVDAEAIFLDAPTWSAFHQAASLASAAEAWLVLQCGLIDEKGLAAVVLMATERGQALKPVAVWPIDAPVGSTLLATAELSAREGRGVLSTAGEAVIAHPIMPEEPALGAVALRFSGGDAGHAFLPHHHVPGCLAYTSTHDSDTAHGWWQTASAVERHGARCAQARDDPLCRSGAA